MARLTLDRKEKCLQMLEQVEMALQLSVNLTTQLLTFSKGGKPAKRKMQLKPVIENSVKFALSGSRAEYRLVYDEDLWGGDVDEGQIGQVIQNVVLNADQAMPVGGTIMVAARNVVAPRKGLPPLPRDGKYVEISVRDCGHGIPEQHLPKIFDPYFTTKEKGSGLGLATSFSIVRNHGGLIDVASERGKGTADSPASRGGQTGRVLLMGDEELVRNIGGELIRSIGHTVELTEDGEAAIEKYRRASESGVPFDIVILDLTIRGGLGGRETIARLLAIDPGISAVVSSGYSDDAVMSTYREYGFKARLQKPYKFKELRDTLAALLVS